MTDSKSFVMVNLEMIQEYDLSFFEVGLLERIRYFSEYDQNGSGWCYVGKERLSKEFGVSKPGLLKAIGRLIERNLLIRNEKGWLQVNIEGVNKVDCQLSLPVNKVSERSKLSLPNKNIKEDISNIDNSYSILLGQQSLPPDEQSSPVNKVSKPRKPKRTELAKRLTDEEFVEEMAKKGIMPCVKFDSPLVLLSLDHWDQLKKRFPVEGLLIEMIKVYNNWKLKKGGVKAYVNDFSGVQEGWVVDNAMKILNAKNSFTYDKMRKQQLMADEFNKSNQLGTTQFFNPEPQE